jgi:hypothetical protein
MNQKKSSIYNNNFLIRSSNKLKKYDEENGENEEEA